jgi:transcriptional regulator with XRE-family HTH domain
MVSIRQVKAARALLAWSQAELAKKSGVSYPTLARLESVDGDLGGRLDTTTKIVNALEAAGAIFVEENGEGPGVRLRKAKAAISDEAAVPEMPEGPAKDYDGSPM